MKHQPLATKLRVLRAERGITVREAATLTGCAKETISEFERGLRKPQLLTLGKIAKGYGIPISELLEAMDQQGKESNDNPL
jgi:transcriptional regulator with XRE-family HTH domain